MDPVIKEVIEILIRSMAFAISMLEKLLLRHKKEVKG